jgi:CelD/BcsL family acetyltransferase involved in cellulose biosynthesis
MTRPQVIDLADPAQLGPLVRDWLELADRLGETSYFQTPDWVLGWWLHIAGRPRTRIAAWRDPSGRLDALVTLSRDRERLHRRIPLALPVYVNAGSGRGAADHCGWLVAPDRRDEVRAWVTQVVRAGGLLLRGADPSTGPPPMPAGARLVEATSCPRMSLADAQALERSPDFRRQLERFSRRLHDEGVEFEWVPAGTLDEPLLMRLFVLHEQARRQHGKDTSFDRAQLPLHRELLRRAGPGRGPAALIARHGREVVGVLYGFRWKDVFAAYQSGWDARFAGHSLGSVLIFQAARLAAADGVRTLDLLRGAEPYKYRFGAVDRSDCTWLWPRGPAGMLLSARYRARQRLRPRLRAAAPASMQ